MEELKKLLTENFPTIDFDKEKHLASDDILDSLCIIQVIGLLKEKYSINFPIEFMCAKNFESIDTIFSTVKEILKQKM